MGSAVVSGAGLVGSLLSVMLKNKGEAVTIYEKRPDMRKQTIDGGRSINLVVTSRGIHALNQVGLWKKVKNICVPVRGRMLHAVSGELTYQPYGKDDLECNYSVSRGELNKLLMNEAEACGVEIHFERPLEDADFSGDNSARLFGADGASSKARRILVQASSQVEDVLEPLESGYKELLMPATKSGDYAMEKNALHIWPRGSHMLMALPNLDGSFTMTLYMPKEGDKVSFAATKSEEDLKGLFAEYYPDALELMPDISNDYFSNPEGVLGTVRCDSWHYRDKICLLGDAAHAIVPFFGQGMNCGFEDCVYLFRALDDAGGDWGEAFKLYDRRQRPNGDAIADMALENFVEMRDSVGDKQFLLRKAVDATLEKTFPESYRTRYAMVVYTLIPYALAQQAGLIQSDILDQLSAGITDINQLNLDKAKSLLAEKFTPFIEKNKISLDRYLG